MLNFNFLNKITLLVLSLFILFGSVDAQITVYKIKVFEDLNKNLIKDTDEQGIEGVRVSNQYSVVQTDKNGYCELPKEDINFIFVVKPENYTTPLTEDNIPIFYNANYPESLSGIKPTGKNNDELYFPLYKENNTMDFSALMLGDPQSRNETEIGYMRDDFVKNFVDAQYKFVVLLGDIVYDKSELYTKTNRVLGKMNIPMYFVPGNHDMDYSAPNDILSLEPFKKVYGPEYYSFDYGNVHFIIADNIAWHGLDGKYKNYVGGFGKKQLEWLKNDLKLVPNEKLLVINMHIPVNSIGGDYVENKIADKDEFFEALGNRERVLLLTGHTHTREHNYYGKEDGWAGSTPIHQVICGAVCGSWWSGFKDYRGIPTAIQLDGGLRGYNVFEFAGNEYIQRYFPVNKAKEYQFNISSPQGVVDMAKIDSADIIVNVFNGNKFTKVTAVINNCEEMVLENVVMGDPIIANMIQDNPKLFRDWMHAEKTSHIWKAKLPNNLSQGVHTLKVKVVNQYNEVFRSDLVFEVK